MVGVGSLTVREAFDLALITDPVNASWLVRWLGYRELEPQYESVSGKRRQIPMPEREKRETDRDYIVRVWDDMHPKYQSLSVRAGLQSATHYVEGLKGGVQYVVYLAYAEGWWLETAEGDGGDTSWKEWVRDAVTMEEQSTSEASQLANTILNLWFLRNNGYDGLPDDLADIFKDRTEYNRWRRVTGKLRHLIEMADEAEEPDDVDEKIQEIIDAVNDPEKTQPELDEVGKQKPKLPPIVLKESMRDSSGRHVVEARVSPAQMNFLRQKLGRMFKLELVGETYGADTHRLVTYRQYEQTVCPVCGGIHHPYMTQCPDCEECLDTVVFWSRRVESEDWESLDNEPEMTGYFASELVDLDLGVRYVGYYEEVNE